MPIHHNWLNAQASRRYPLDDNATGTGDDGTRIKDDILLDAHIRWPSLAGQYIFLGGLTVTDTIVTAVFLAADSTTEASNFTPLAAVTLPQPVTRHRFYNVEPLYPGVGGFVAFGDVGETFSIRFSTPQQGLLAPKVGRPYTELPIPSMRKFGRVDGLTGLVKILAGNDIEVVKETVTIAVDDLKEDHEAMVIRLLNPTSTRNVLSDYIGPCGKRPESRNCLRAGIESINGVSPDCHGDLRIEFLGLTPGPYEDCGSWAAGVTLDQSAGIEDVCTDPPVDRFSGEDYCEPSAMSSSSFSSASASDYVPPETPSSSDGWPTSSAADVPAEELPFTDSFDDEFVHHSWTLGMGQYALVPGVDIAWDELHPATCWSYWTGYSSISSSSSQAWSSSSSYSCYEDIQQSLQLKDASRRNVFFWQDDGTGGSIGKVVTSLVQLTSQGARQNGGVLLNYHIVEPIVNPRIEYHVVQINRNENRVELVRYNGAILILENFATPAIPFSLTDWYEITAYAEEEGDGVRIHAQVRNYSSPVWPTVSFSMYTTRWGESDGYFGVHTNRAITNFATWSLAHA